MLKKLWNFWLKLAHYIGEFNSKLILSLFYFLLLAPIATIYKIKCDILQIKKKGRNLWHQYTKIDNIDSLKRQS